MKDLMYAMNVSLAGGVAPEWVQLLPPGPVVLGVDGREWRFNPEQHALVRQRFAASNLDLPIDWEHATEKKGSKGEPAPAAAWIVELADRNGDGGLWGRVKWTEKGRNDVESGAYRYLSPVFVYSRTNLLIQAMDSAGLTNKPNLRLTALNRQAETTMEEEHPMKKALCKRLGLDPETATEQQIQDAVSKLQGDLEKASNRAMPDALLAALGLEGGAGADQAVAKAKELAGTATATNRAQAAGTTLDLSSFVPRADYELALNRATKAEDKLKQREATELDGKIDAAINQAIRDGKIAPSSKDYYVAACRAEGGLDKFVEFAKAAPQVIKDPQLPAEPKSGASGLTDAQRAVCRNLGLSEEDFAKSMKEE